MKEADRAEQGDKTQMGDLSPEEKIIRSAISCIDEFGVAGATNRRIALAAGVNSAAINYYFRSKEILIQRCLAISLKNAFDISDLPPMPEATARERFAFLMEHLVEGGFRYPGLTRAHFHGILEDGHEDPLLLSNMEAYLGVLAADLGARDPALSGERLKPALAMALSGLLLMILAPRLFAAQAGCDLRDAGQRAAYIGRLAGGLLG